MNGATSKVLLDQSMSRSGRIPPVEKPYPGR